MAKIKEVPISRYRVSEGYRLTKRRVSRYRKDQLVYHWSKAYQITLETDNDFETIFPTGKPNLDNYVCHRLSTEYFDGKEIMFVENTSNYYTNIYGRWNTNTLIVVKEEDAEIITEPSSEEKKKWDAEDKLHTESTLLKTFCASNLKVIMDKYNLSYFIDAKGELYINFKSDQDILNFVINHLEQTLFKDLKEQAGITVYKNKRIRKLNSYKSIIDPKHYEFNPK